MSETESEGLGPIAVGGAILLVLLGVANYAGTGCTGLIGTMYDGMIYLGDSVTVIGLVGTVGAFTVNRFVAPNERRPTERQRSSSDRSLFVRILGFGDRKKRSIGSHEDEDGEAPREAWTVLAIRFSLVLLLVGLLLTVAGWWMAGIYDVQCTSGFWSGFLSGRLPL